jgi:hypothetical protein
MEPSDGFDITHAVHQSQILQVILQLVVHRGLFPLVILRLHQATSIDLGDLGTVDFLHEMLAELKLDLLVVVEVKVPADGVESFVFGDCQSGWLPDDLMDVRQGGSCLCRVSMTVHGY